MDQCRHPKEAWSTQAAQARDATPRYLPADWQSRVRLPDPPEAPECARLILLRETERKGRRLCEIRDEAEGDFQGVMRPILKELSPGWGVWTREMLDAAMRDIEIAVMKLKAGYNRGRPRQCCGAQAIDPLYWPASEKAPADHYPMHPAYPSGHSTQAHAIALLLSALAAPDEALRQRMRQAAERVAENREVAGFHYPSDSSAGAELAAQLVTMLLASQAFVDGPYAKARSEWPATP